MSDESDPIFEAIQAIQVSTDIMVSMLAQSRGIALQMRLRARRKHGVVSPNLEQVEFSIKRGEELMSEAQELLARLHTAESETWRVLAKMNELNKEVQDVVMKSVRGNLTGS